MEEMNQLEMFMEELGHKKKSEVSDEKETEVAPPVPQKTKSRKTKRSSGEDRSACIRVSAGTLKRMKLLAIWMDENGQSQRATLMSIAEEAVECLIDERYPKAKKWLTAKCGWNS